MRSSRRSRFPIPKL
jgi:transposase InsO family protein